MKPVPTISPELHGLLDEIVSDPRSALRLAPRRALLPWIDSGDTVSGRPLAAGRAERQLLAVHREELARVLAEAARIGCQGSIDFLQGLRRPDGTALEIGAATAEWRVRQSRAASVPDATDFAQAKHLLARAIDPGTPPHVLAMASLSLVPTDLGRYGLGLSLAAKDPVTAIKLLSRVATRATDLFLRSDAWNNLGAIFCRFEWVEMACDAYRESARLRPQANICDFSLFNLSCFLGDARSALSYSESLSNGRLDDGALREAAAIIGRWAEMVSGTSLLRARRTVKRLRSRLSPPALLLAGSVDERIEKGSS